MTNSDQPATVFTLTIDAQEMRVRYRPYFIDGVDPTPFLSSQARTSRAAAFP